MAEEESGSSHLQQFVLLAKSSKGPACVALINQAIEHPHIYVFGELLEMQNIQELAGTAAAPSLELLKIFAYGTYKDYQANAQKLSLPQLSPTMLTKLRKLTVVTLSEKSKLIPYDSLLDELNIANIRELEDLLIDTMYEQLLRGKLDQKFKRLEVHYAIGRDIRPGEIEEMAKTLQNWHTTSVMLLGCLQEKMTYYKSSREAHRLHQEEFDKKVEAVKANLRAQMDTGDMGGSSADFDALDYEEDKFRKSGRPKSKHMMGMLERRTRT